MLHVFSMFEHFDRVCVAFTCFDLEALPMFEEVLREFQVHEPHHPVTIAKVHSLLVKESMQEALTGGVETRSFLVVFGVFSLGQ